MTDATAAAHSLLDAIGGVPRPTGDDIVVDARDVEKWFGKLHVLKGVSMEVKRQEVVVIIGASGSGKTTFIRCINHLERIQKGRIFVNGHLIGYREVERQAGRGQGEEHRQAARGHRDGVPALQPVPAHDGARERRRGADPGPRRGQGRGGRRIGQAAARAGRPRASSTTPTRASCPAGSSSASRSPGRWR